MAEGFPSSVLALKEELGPERCIVDQWQFGAGKVEAVQGEDSLWLVVKPVVEGGVALRAGYLLGNRLEEVSQIGSRSFLLSYSAGSITVEVESNEADLRVRSWLTPCENLILPYVPRDLYPLGRGNDPVLAKGDLHALQAGLAAPVVYFSIREPDVGSFLYFQNLTALNPYFNLTETSPEGSVAGKWPELGYLAPTSQDKPLPGGQEVLLSDVILAYEAEIPQQPKQVCRLFLDFLARIYGSLDKTDTVRHDWPYLAKKALKDMAKAPTATVEHWGCKYLHPYNDAEYPDCMVQTNVLHGLQDMETWLGRKLELREELRKGVGRFYDKDLKTIRRYLPNVGEDKNRDEVDSWYMYHPLMSLARLARDGQDEDAKKLFFDSLDTAIRFARKFKYRWPVMFSLSTGKVIREKRREGEDGQTDVAGLYAYVMMHAYELSGNKKYVREAQKSLAAVEGLCFEIAYQLNITAWGVTGCIRVWKETKDAKYLDQAAVFLAAFFRHTIFWESDIKVAKEYPVFMGVLCLDDSRYMSCFECHESFEAFSEALALAGEALPHSMRLLVSEYCKYAMHRAWHYHPRFLKQENLSKEVRNGKIDRSLYFPLEDLYPDGKPAGQVGQEIYGCGASFAFTTHAFNRFKGAPFLLYCEYPIRELEVVGKTASFEITGAPEATCKLEVIHLARGKRTGALLEYEGKEVSLSEGRPVEVPGGAKAVISWL